MTDLHETPVFDTKTREPGSPALDSPLGPREPEKLVIPAQAVALLLQYAIRTEVGNAWWSGFVTAHGEPTWIVAGAWGFQARECEVVKVPVKRPDGKG